MLSYALSWRKTRRLRLPLSAPQLGLQSRRPLFSLLGALALGLGLQLSTPGLLQSVLDALMRLAEDGQQQPGGVVDAQQRCLYLQAQPQRRAVPADIPGTQDRDQNSLACVPCCLTPSLP